MHLRVAILLLWVVCVSCDKAAAPPAPPKRKLVAEWQSVVSLRANQRTLLAAGTGGRVFVAQPDADKTLAVQSIDSAGDVRATQLSSLRIAELLKAPGGVPLLRAMVALDDGRILACYGGTLRTRSLACLVLFDPANESLRLLASPDDLARASDMGLTLDLAEAELALAGDSIWLWLRHVDESVFLRIDARQVASGTVRLAKPFSVLRLDEATFRPDPSDRIFGQIDATLYLIRRSTGELWRLSREGRAYRVEAPSHAGRMTAPPLTLTPAGAQPTRLWFFADPGQTHDNMAPPVVGDSELVRYPVLLIQEPEKSTILDRAQMDVRMAFPLHAMRVTNWAYDRSGDRIVAYDAMSGEVFRLQISRR